MYILYIPAKYYIRGITAMTEGEGRVAAQPWFRPRVYQTLDEVQLGLQVQSSPLASTEPNSLS